MEQIGNIPGLMLVPLKSILNIKGDIYHGMKSSDPGFAGFGEAYFSTVYHGDVKGWKKHTRMVLNLVVPIGAIRFVICDERSGKQIFFEVTLSLDNYYRLCVPSGVWMAFQGIGQTGNMLLNLASIEHDSNEVVGCELESISYKWEYS